MRASTLEIIWHAKEPVLSVDFHPSDPRLFATGGGDKDVKVRPGFFVFVVHIRDGRPKKTPSDAVAHARSPRSPHTCNTTINHKTTVLAV